MGTTAIRQGSRWSLSCVSCPLRVGIDPVRDLGKKMVCMPLFLDRLVEDLIYRSMPSSTLPFTGPYRIMRLPIPFQPGLQNAPRSVATGFTESLIAIC